MKHYVAIDESRKVGHLRAAKILSRLMARWGRRTWIGRLSQEDLEGLVSELRKSATKASRIVILDVSKPGTARVTASVGREGRINDDDGYAHKIIGLMGKTPKKRGGHRQQKSKGNLGP